MLSSTHQKWLFFITFAVACLIQIISANSHQLFGDEAFYWLESQHLDWSYAELPGWTQWMIALSQQWLPKSEFTVRLPSLLAAFCLPWIGLKITRAIQDKPDPIWNTGLLYLALPLSILAGILALPDIWVLFFGTFAVMLLLNSLQKRNRYWFVGLGVVLALGLNVHVRFWMVVFIAALVTVWQFRSEKEIINRLFTITLPIMLLGFVPILIFNSEQDFPLLAFQFSDRHPWSFQANHLKFFVIQILVTTPLVFLLFALTTLRYKKLNKLQKTLLSIALFHWLLYAVVGFFSDDIRFNWHWTLLSYLLMAVVTGSTVQNPKLVSWAKYSGILCSMIFMVWLFWALHISKPISEVNARFTENARGWKELAQTTQQHIKSSGAKQIVTDHFMTLATLNFYLENNMQLTSLSHPLNHKHGRQSQLDIMGYSNIESADNQLLVVEHSALKLEQTIPFYQQACEKLNGIKLIDTLDYQQGIKSFYFFETGTRTCEIPPVIYTTAENQRVSGWVLHQKPQELRLSINGGKSADRIKAIRLGDNPLFKSLDTDSYQLSEFTFASETVESSIQINLIFNNLEINSPRIVVD